MQSGHNNYTSRFYWNLLWSCPPCLHWCGALYRTGEVLQLPNSSLKPLKTLIRIWCRVHSLPSNSTSSLGQIITVWNKWNLMDMVIFKAKQLEKSLIIMHAELWDKSRTPCCRTRRLLTEKENGDCSCFWQVWNKIWSLKQRNQDVILQENGKWSSCSLSSCLELKRWDENLHDCLDIDICFV